MLSVNLICLLLASSCICAHFPSTFKKCNRKESDFNKCLTKAVEDAVRQLNKPIKELGLPSMEPLEIPSLTIGAGSGPVALAQIYKNVKVSGFTKINFSKVDVNFEKKTITMEYSLPESIMQSQYEVKGRILLLPVYGTGPSIVTLDKLKNVLTFTLEEYEKKGTKYFKVIDTKLVMTPALIKFQFDNLFDGDKALGDNINKVVNENWQEVFADVKTSYEDAFAQVYFAIFNNLLAKLSISELFGDK